MSATPADLSKHVLTMHPRLSAGSESPNRVQNLPGYTTPVFKGKEEQRALVETDVASKVIILLFVG
jgi:glutamate dehydrogenase